MLALLPAVALAQVNAENLAAGGDGVGAALSAGAAVATGNVDLVDLRGEAALRVQSSFDDGWLRDRALLTVHGAYRSFFGTRILDERLAHLRGTHMLSRRFGLDAFAQAQNDLALLLEWRLAAGPGVRLAAVHTEALDLWGGTGVMAEVEIRDVPELGPDARLVLNVRSTTYVAWRAAVVEDHLTWTSTAYVQPRVDDWADVQVVDETALEAAVTQALSMSTGLRLRLDTRPPADLAPVDVRLWTGLTARYTPRRE